MLGISIDKPAAARAFALKLGASFPILSDAEKTTSKAYGVLNFTRLFANRVTFVIDKNGVIQHIEKGSEAIGTAGSLRVCSLLQGN